MNRVPPIVTKHSLVASESGQPPYRSAHPLVLITVPVRNESRMLFNSVTKLSRDLEGSDIRYRLSIAEDGSTDDTLSVIDELVASIPNLIVKSSPNRLGRGLALRRMWSQFDADIYAFIDADLAAGPEALVRVISQVQRGADVVTGSRYCPGARVHRPPVREWVSRYYNAIVRFWFKDDIQDHQCGLKAFTREAMTRLMQMTSEASWAWDTEVLVFASRSGMRVVEVPVDWVEYRFKRTPFRRLASDVYLHGLSLLRLKARLEEGLSASKPPSSKPFQGDAGGSGSSTK